MALFVSVNGGDRVSAQDVVLYDEGTPIAAAMMHGNIVFYADSVRDTLDLIKILQSLGIDQPIAKAANIEIRGSVDRDRRGF